MREEVFFLTDERIKDQNERENKEFPRISLQEQHVLASLIIIITIIKMTYVYSYIILLLLRHIKKLNFNRQKRVFIQFSLLIRSPGGKLIR